MIKMKYLLNDKQLPEGTIEMTCPLCKRKFAVPLAETLMLNKNCEECSKALEEAKFEIKNEAPEELKAALGE